MDHVKLRVFCDESLVPPMFGVECGDGIKVCRLSTDGQEVMQWADRCNQAGLSLVHFWDAVEDFRHI